MDESKRNKGQAAAVEAGALPPSGSDGGVQTSGSSPLGDSVPPLPAESPPAENLTFSNVNLKNFDILAAMKEAEQFALEVKRFADLIPDPRWQAISRGMDYAIQVHDRLNQARANS